MLLYFSIYLFSQGLTKSLGDAVQDDEFAISIKRVKTKKIDYSGKETLVAAKYPDPDTKFIFMLDRHNNRREYQSK